jgi:hypothetical protein
VGEDQNDLKRTCLLNGRKRKYTGTHRKLVIGRQTIEKIYFNKDKPKI